MGTEDDALKLALLVHLSNAIRSMGSSHDIVAGRLGIARPDVTAIHAGDTRRFTFERIRRMLRRVGRDLNIDLVPADEGGHVEFGVTLSALGLEHLRHLVSETGSGLVLIAGESNNGQQQLLQALIAEHLTLGASAITYTATSRRQFLHPRRSNFNRERVVAFESDIDLEQRARFGCDVVGIDATGKGGADPWTVLHFAKSARTYAVIESESGSAEGQYAFDQFASLLGPPYAKAHKTPIYEVLREIVVMHAAVNDTGGVSYFASRHKAQFSDLKIVPSNDSYTENALKRAAKSRSNTASGMITSSDEARAFLRDVHELLGVVYEVEAPIAEMQREIEMIVRHRSRGASVTVAASWNNSAKRFGIVLSTEEPDDLIELGRTPETRLSLAPTDSQFVAGAVSRFLSQFDSSDSPA